ncbi:hypothetical protein MPSEU_000017500 [Mayamaea pseudoterrestris]|nr:hypothetical protein MPSEU_000017500 [Mayamaea pseudoterrestris]
MPKRHQPFGTMGFYFLSSNRTNKKIARIWFMLGIAKMTRGAIVKDLWILRHGQAMHNPIAEAKRAAGCSHEEFLQQMKDDDVLDAPLTELGVKQAQAVHSAYHALYHEQVQLVVSSPLSRAIETANHAIPNHENRVVYEHVREINGWLLNAKRKRKQDLMKQFPAWSLDELEHEEDVYWTEELETEADCSERGYQTLSWLMHDRPETSVFMVAHGGILRFLMTMHSHITVKDGRRQENGLGDSRRRDSKARFDNCELRRYRMEVDEHHCVDNGNTNHDDRPRLVLTELNLEQ